MKGLTRKLATTAMMGAGMALALTTVAEAAEPKKGGVLEFVVGSRIPSYDGHREGTFGMIHPIRPFYNTLIRINPNNPSSTTDFVCDVCVGDVPAPTDDGKTYTFKIREGIKFHNGQSMTAKDVAATYERLRNPPEGVRSLRKAYFSMIESVTAPDDTTVVFKLKTPSNAFIPAVAMPFNFIYSVEDMAKDNGRWVEKNINGTGPFIFEEHQPGSYVKGKRNPNYHHAGMPYLDGFRAIAAPKMSTRLNAIRGGRALAEFRGFPPKAIADLKKALGDNLVTHESPWNCTLGVTFNQKREAMADKRVRRALSMAIDRWGGSKYLSQIAIVKTVGGIVFPGHPLAATEAELAEIPGYGKDVEANRAEAKRLLKEAGRENLKIKFINRGVDQPYKVVGTWLVDQWKRVGVTANQVVEPSTPFFNNLRNEKDFDASIDFNCQAVVNPILDTSKFISSARASNNYGQVDDPKADALYDAMVAEADPAKQRQAMRAYEKHVLGDEAHWAMTLWWNRLNAHHAKMKGWKNSPSHYLNQTLENVWLDG